MEVSSALGSTDFTSNNFDLFSFSPLFRPNSPGFRILTKINIRFSYSPKTCSRYLVLKSQSRKKAPGPCVLGEGESPRLLARESWVLADLDGLTRAQSRRRRFLPGLLAPGTALNGEARPRRLSVRNGSSYLERHGGTQLRDSLAHPASGAAQAGGCTETLETLGDSGPVLHDRKRGRGTRCTERRRVGSVGSARRFASREVWSRFPTQPPASQR